MDAPGIIYRGCYTDDGQVVYNCRIRAMPTTAFISFEGRVLRVWTGLINRDRLEVIVAAIPEGEQTT